MTTDLKVSAKTAPNSVKSAYDVQVLNTRLGGAGGVYPPSSVAAIFAIHVTIVHRVHCVRVKTRDDQPV